MKRSSGPCTSGSFRHGTTNVQKKALASLDDLIDRLDERFRWDAWSVQEILRPEVAGSAGADEVRILRDAGRHRHLAVVGGVRRGSHCVGIIVHNRWAPYVQNIKQGFRCIALTIQVQAAASRQKQSLQIISAHFPSSLARTSAEVSPAIAAWSALIAGQRRSSIVCGIDANIELVHPVASRVGSALSSRRRRSSRGADMEDLRGQVVEELEAHDLRAANTFEEWHTKNVNNVDETAT